VQDALEVAPHVYTVVLENDRVRILSFMTRPGEAWGLHSHPDSVVVSLTDYSVRNVIPGGPPTERHSMPGDVRWIPATAHTGENIGTTEMRGILIELKEPRG
jgi:beta-alanine degradation protein BauB